VTKLFIFIYAKIKAKH